MGKIRVKICGITRPEDARAAVAAGADALGFIFYPPSPRNISAGDVGRIVKDLPPFVTRVGVFVNDSVERIGIVAHTAGLNLVQLAGDEDAKYISGLRGIPWIKAIRVENEKDIEGCLEIMKLGHVLLDSKVHGVMGGSGKSFDWSLVKDRIPGEKIVLAGGLNVENIEEAIRVVKPYAVDVSSGVESSPGIKDHDKIREFIALVRELEKEIERD